MKEKVEVYKVVFNDDIMTCSWSCKGVGFGQLDIMLNRSKDSMLTDLINSNDKEFLIAAEGMSEDFIKEILLALIEYLIKNSAIIE